MNPFVQLWQDVVKLWTTYAGLYLNGIWTTIYLAVICTAIGCLIGLLCGGIDLSKWDIVLKEAVMEGEVELAPAVTLGLGTFLTSIINFILIAFVVFLFVKAMNAAKKPKEEEPAPDPEPSNEEKLLMEIRDLLKEKQ